jgi:hypothetical protein
MTQNPGHGTHYGYTNGRCREACCRQAASRAYNLWQLRRIANGDQPLRMTSIGAKRRLRALMAIGWPRRVLAREAGYTSDAFSPILLGRGRTTIDVATHQRIVDLYERLRDIPGPSARTRAHAAREQWAGPEGTLLTERVWRDASIDLPSSRPATPRDAKTWRNTDLAAEWDVLRSAGLNLTQAAERLGITRARLTKALERHRSNHRQENPAA